MSRCLKNREYGCIYKDVAAAASPTWIASRDATTYAGSSQAPLIVTYVSLVYFICLLAILFIMWFSGRPTGAFSLPLSELLRHTNVHHHDQVPTPRPHFPIRL